MDLQPFRTHSEDENTTGKSTDLIQYDHTFNLRSYLNSNESLAAIIDFNIEHIMLEHKFRSREENIIYCNANQKNIIKSVFLRTFNKNDVIDLICCTFLYPNRRVEIDLSSETVRIIKRT